MNPMDLLRQFGNLQERMNEVQERLKGVRVTGTAGGDMVQIDLNGQMEVLAVRISSEAVDPGEIAMLQDLVRAAFADAGVKIKDRIREELSSLTGGLNLPPGFLGL